MSEDKNPYEYLAFKLAVEQTGCLNTFVVSPPATTSECVRATFHAVLSCGHHIDNILDEYESILADFRGTVIIEEDEE